ncbi:DJ-1/PfpI family protein [Aliikangiella sp. G2MR2-5]|uniref:DJ-1/PfpI family protein n=1 Tax=Aliikangiella sp. G2MR2-5 TaxID=2788943 RepID=UPI0018A90EB2|nr:DJ-1/PfpI family protein [Aliikangiella sp. G2MR2-5]
MKLVSVIGRNIFLLALVTLTLEVFAGTKELDEQYGDKANHRILMVVSSYGKKQGEEQPGFEFDELAKAYLTFRDSGFEIDIASPRGGKVEADKFNAEKTYNKELLSDSQAVNKINNTRAIEVVNKSDYDAIFIVGGKGAMFDLPKNEKLKQLIAEVYQTGGVIGAVCHGPAALVNVKLKDGSYLVKGKKVNGFTNQEEKLFGKKWVKHFDFLLEDKLKERGAIFESSPMMLSHVAIDNRLITGQNPTSTVDVARAMIGSLGGVLAKGNDYSDDMTLKLVAKIIQGDKSALKRYRQDKNNLEPSLLGMYGFYMGMSAKSDDAIRTALQLMIIAQEDMQHPRMGLEIAKAHHKLGQVEQAKSVLNKLLKNNPEFVDAEKLLQAL